MLDETEGEIQNWYSRETWNIVQKTQNKDSLSNNNKHNTVN